jgi:prefoldin beta subunit
MEMSKEMQKKIMEFQQVQEQARIVVAQKLRMDIELKSAKKALEELEKMGKGKVHKAVGNVLIETDKESTIKELKETIDTLELNLKSLEKQETTLKNKLKSLQDRLQGVISGEKGG